MKRLLKNHEYEFRISCQNKYGVGDHLISDPITAKLSANIPECPGQPEYATSTNQSITITYNRPKTDGGSQIIGR